MSSNRPRTLLFVIACIALTCGCVRYYTRTFEPEQAQAFAAGYAVVPEVVAFRGSHRANPKQPSTFSISVSIRSADTTKTASHRHEIDSLFYIDSCEVNFIESGNRAITYKSGQSYEHNFSASGKVFRFLPGPTIPNGIDTIDLRFPFYSLDSAGVKVERDPVCFRMIRHESSCWFLVLD